MSPVLAGRDHRRILSGFPIVPRYAAGGFDFPTSGGAYSVTGLGFHPQLVILMGGNRPEVDTLVTGATGPGLFVSVNALDWTDPYSVRSFCLALHGRSSATPPVANYRGYELGCISMPADGTTAATIDYRASLITFDGDGFTITVTHPAPGRRPIHWLAIGNPVGDYFPIQTGAVKQSMTASGAITLFPNPYFRPTSSLVLGTIGRTGFGEGFVNNSCWYSLGTAHYPEGATDKSQWKAAVHHAQIQLSSGVGRQGFLSGRISESQPNISHVVGPGTALSEGYRRHRPYGDHTVVPPESDLDATDVINEGGGFGSDQFQMGVVWNAEGWAGGISTPAGIGGRTVIPPRFCWPFEVVLFTSINGTSESAGATQQRFGVGVLHRDYQGCVAFGHDGSFFQSASRALANCSVAGGARAAFGEVSINGSFRLTNDLGDGTVAGYYHGFGGPASAPIVPPPPLQEARISQLPAEVVVSPASALRRGRTTQLPVEVVVKTE